MMRAPRLGLTGGIGSGKSTVAAQLAALGAHIVDTDAISRALTAPGGAALPAIAQAFGPDMIDNTGALDRARMRELAFNQAAAKQQLEQILHPLIGQETARQADAAPPHQPVIFDVPLLTESAHWRRQVDRILLVDCAEAVQLARVRARSGWPEAEVRRVIALQATRAQRRAIADAVVVNEDKTLPELAAELQVLWAQGFFAAGARGGV